ncbi:MAG: hypothetical protein HPY54_06510 [Chthonomonadetes bacterium]|nr:hypothetical protein [Chthonomonadetes bacterium]
MPITPADIDAFIELLRQDPALRQRVFAAIAPEEFLALPAKVDRLAGEVSASRTASEERFARIEAILERLAESQSRTEAEIAELRKAIDLFRQAAQERFQKLEDEWAKLLGRYLEEQYAKHIYSYFGHVLCRMRLLTPSDIDDLVRPALTIAEVKDLFLADIIARGRLLEQPDQQVYLVMEVSRTIDESDVARARRRADLMRKAGLPCVAAVGGEQITEAGRLEAEHSQVLCMLDGNLEGDWQESLARSLQEG